MKVLCIKKQWKEFEIGGIYEVTDTFSSKHNGKEYWYYEFIHTPKGVGFRVESFSPLSNIDELKLVNHKEECV